MKSGNIFEGWVASQYPGASWNCEVYGTAPRAAGGNWDGWIDLLIELPDNKIVLVDHKTAPLSGDQCLNRAREYSGQLTAYREMLESRQGGGRGVDSLPVRCHDGKGYLADLKTLD